MKKGSEMYEGVRERDSMPDFSNGGRAMVEWMWV